MKRKVRLWRERASASDKGRNAVDAQSVTIGALVQKYREVRQGSGRPVKEKSDEDYILRRLHDAFSKTLLHA